MVFPVVETATGSTGFVFIRLTEMDRIVKGINHVLLAIYPLVLQTISGV